MNKLAISSDFSLPVDVMTEAMALLATRKRGKTHTATVFAEELLKQRQQVVIMDPVGLYWGLRSNAAGNGEGYRILILGGSHGDLPLAVADAAMIAQFVVSEEASVVIDISQFASKAEQVRFCEVFFDRIWHLKQAHRTPMLLILEESQEFAPQRPREKEQVMLGRIERIAKLGRNYGIGLLLITQRPASLNKDVLDLIGILIVLGVVAAIERKVVREWLQGQDLGDHADLVNTLPGLPVGDAYIWMPEQSLIKRIHVRKRETFDSSATPKVGQARVEPGKRAAVDIEVYKARLGSLIEKAKAEDPVQLKRRVVELERELSKRSSPVVEVREKKIEVPTVPAKLITELRQQGLRLEAAGGDLIAVGKKLAAIGAEYGRSSPELSRGYRQSLAIEVGRAHKREPLSNGNVRAIKGEAEQVRKPRWESANGSVSKAQQQILDAAAFLEQRGIHSPDIVQLALLSKQASGGGYWRSNIGRLRSMGLMNGTSLTASGRDLAQPPDIATTAELQAFVMTQLSAAQRAILQSLIDVYPSSLDAAAVADSAGKKLGRDEPLEVNGGYWRSNIGRLRTLKLMTKKGPMAALPVLFIEEGVAV